MSEAVRYVLFYDSGDLALAAENFAGHKARYEDFMGRGGPPRGPSPVQRSLEVLLGRPCSHLMLGRPRLYWENTCDFFGIHNVAIPAAVSVFPKEIHKAPRSRAERAYLKLIYFNEVDRGCHFAA